jgi:GDPmannose 4,6-dehydratase
VKTAVISGITGQTGSYLAELLLEKGYKVVGIRRRTSTFNTERLEPFYNHPNLKTEWGNINDFYSLYTIIKKYQPDEVYNLAAMSHVRVSFECTEEAFDTAGKGCLNMLNICKELVPNVRFYQASSSEMFGVAPCPEGGYTEDSKFEPASPYACAKLMSHHLVKNYRASYGLHASSGISFNHESKRRGETFVTRKISQASARIKLGKQEKLYLGNLDSMRDWSHAEDVARAMWLMLQQDTPDDYVVASGETHSVKEFLEKTFELAGLDINKHVEFDNRLLRPQEVPYLLGNPTKVKEKLGWKPKYSFDDLVREMYESDLILSKTMDQNPL